VAPGTSQARETDDKELCRNARTGIIARMNQPAIRPACKTPNAFSTPGRWIAAAALGFLLILQAGCMPGGRLAGLDSFALSDMAPDHGGETWLALPMDRWLGTREGVGRPRAVIACLTDPCRNRLAAAVFELEGEAAHLAERDLRDPQTLLRSLELAARDGRRARNSGNGNTRGPATAIAIDVTPLTIGDLSGFEIALHSETGQQRRVYGAGLGRRVGGNILVVVLAIGDDPHVVRAAAAQIRERAF
jgi:hypothetical protein